MTNKKAAILPSWCLGCGNFGIFTALNKSFTNLKLKPYQLVVVADVGCCGNIADFVNAYCFHALHGRALPPAAGIKLANHQLKVIVIIGDGGCYGEGLGHLLNLMRGNHEITVLVHDNYLYSLTTGQYSPTTPKGTITKTTPNGSVEEALNPLALAIANHATFISRGYAFDVEHLTEIISQAINHLGFSLVDILQPCVTLNKIQTVKNWYQQKIYRLGKPFAFREQAFKEAKRSDKLGIGIFWQEKSQAYHQYLKPLTKETLISKSIKTIDIGKLLNEFI